MSLLSSAKEFMHSAREITGKIGAALTPFSLAAAITVSPAPAHDYWIDGKKIPEWVKASCCGPADAHHLDPGQVHRISGRRQRFQIRAAP